MTAPINLSDLSRILVHPRRDAIEPRFRAAGMQVPIFQRHPQRPINSWSDAPANRKVVQWMI
jgi:hypothetical protein